MANRYRDQCPLDCKVYVGELGNSGTRHEIEEAFGYYGPLRNVWVARNPPGFAFVMFEDPRDARDAVRALDGKVVCGRRIKAELSTGKSRRDGNPRGAYPSRGDMRGYPPPPRSRSPRNGDYGRDRDYGHHRELPYESSRDHHYRRYPEPRSRSRSFSPVNADHRGSSKYGPSDSYKGHGASGTTNGNGISKHAPHRTPPSRSRSRSPVSKSPRSEARYH